MVDTWSVWDHWEETDTTAYTERAIFASVTLYAKGRERIEDAYLVEEVTTNNLPTVEDAFGIVNMTHTYSVSESSDGDYEYNDDALYYWTRDSAINKARQLGAVDWSNEFNAMEVKA